MYHSTSSQLCVHHAVTAGQCGNAFAENIFAYILYILHLRFVLLLCTTAVWQFAMNDYVMLCYVFVAVFLRFHSMAYSDVCVCPSQAVWMDRAEVLAHDG